MIVEVESEADARGELVPRALRLGHREIAVAAVLDEWPGAGHRYVKLRGADGALYILRHDETKDVWELTMYQAGGQEGARA